MAGEIWCPTLGGTPAFIDLPTTLVFYYSIILLSYCPIILLSYYPIILLSYYFIAHSFQQETIITLLLYNSLNTITKDSHLRRGGQLLGRKDLLAVTGLALAMR